MTRPATIALLSLLPACALFASQAGTADLADGTQLEGSITFAKKSITVEEGGGKSHTIPIDQLRLVTLSEEPGGAPAVAAATGNGLRGRYYSNVRHEDIPVERIDANVSFDWGEARPDPAVRPNGFSVRWEGEVAVPVGGEITFEVQCDDGCRLWVDGTKLIDQWQAQTTIARRGTIGLEADRRYPIKLEYYDAWGIAVARLRWEAEGLPREIIPSKHLFPLATKRPERHRFHHEVCLRSGSTLSGVITAADTRQVHLTTADGPVIIPSPAVGYLKFARSWGNDLGVLMKLKPPGVAYLNRDYAEGRFREFGNGIATMESILFGKQEIQQSELRAIKLAEPVAKPARFWVLTTSDLRLYLNTIESLPDGRLKAQDACGYHLKIPAAQIRQVRVGGPFDKDE